MKTNFVSINNIKFKRKIIPGDQLIIESNLKSLKRGIAMGNSIGRVNSEIACSAILLLQYHVFLIVLSQKK